MSEIAPTPVSVQNTGFARGVASAPERHTDAPDAAPARRGDDRVEVSQVATYLSKLKLLPAVRQDLVDAVRGQIRDGVYETPEKIEAVIDELSQELR